MFQLLYPLYLISGVGLILIIVKFYIIRFEVKRHKNKEIDFNNERKSWRPFRNRGMEYGITLCATFVSFYGSYTLQKYKSLSSENRQAFQLCFSAQDKVSQFDDFLKSYGLDSSNNFDMRTPDSVILRSFIKEYYDSYKPFYLLDHLSPEAISLYLKPIPFATISWLETNEKSALKTTFNEQIPAKHRIRTLYAAYQFDSLRRYVFYDEQQYLQGQISPDSFYSLLHAANVANIKVIQLLTPAFHAEINLVPPMNSL